MSVGQVVGLLEELSAKIDEKSWSVNEFYDLSERVTRLTHSWCTHTMQENHAAPLDMRTYIGQSSNPKFYYRHSPPVVAESAPGKA